MAARLFLQVLLLASLSFPFPAKADFLSTFGIRPFWDMEQTQEAFLRAGIDEFRFDGSKGSELISVLSTKSAEEWADDVTERISPRPNPAKDCLYYRNGIDPRDDIFAVAVCFIDRQYQHLVMVFFRTGKVDAQTLRQNLNEKYGKTEDDIWIERPGVYGKLLATKHISLFDFADIKAEIPAVSGMAAALMYVNHPQLAEYVNDKREEIKEAAEQAKKDARKGL